MRFFLHNHSYLLDLLSWLIIVFQFIDNYRSALYKLRKTIRVLEVLIFTEDCSGIGTTKTIYVRPWLETLKDMERKITQIQEQHNNDDHSLGQFFIRNGFY